MNPNVAAYFRELLGRISSKSPTFFKIYRTAMAGLSLASYLPMILCNYFNVDLPPHFVRLCTDIGTFSLASFLNGFLPTSSPAVAIKDNGEILNQTDENKLPFTKMCENKQRDKLESIPMVSEIVDIKPEESSIVKPTPEESKDE